MRRRHILVVVGLVLALGLMLWARGGSRDDPRVAGRRLSSWFRDITRDPMVWALGQSYPYQEPVVGMAADVFRSQGTNAVPFLIGELVRSTQDSAVGEFLDGVNNELPRALKMPRVERTTRRDAALGVLAQLDLRLADLLPAVEPLLKSPDFAVKAAAIRALGCVRRDPAEAAVELRDYAGSTDPMEVRVAIKALTSLGAVATNALDEILKFAAKVAPHSEVNAVLRMCGPAAEATLPMLEDQWKAATDKSGRLNLAITLCCIRPGHPEAWAFLESVARGWETRVPFRIHPTDLVGSVRSMQVGDPQFTPLLLEIARADTNGLARGGGAIADALNRCDPGAADRYLRERMASMGRTNTHLQTSAAAQLLRLQPTNDFARAHLMRQAESGGEDARSVYAALALASAGDLPLEMRKALEEMARDSKLHPQFREELAKRLKWVRLREQLKEAAPGR